MTTTTSTTDRLRATVGSHGYNPRPCLDGFMISGTDGQPDAYIRDTPRGGSVVTILDGRGGHVRTLWVRADAHYPSTVRRVLNALRDGGVR